jgi:hypothetical protein
MSDHDKGEIARLERLNADLTRSLKRCRELLDQWRSRLAANNNDARIPDLLWQDDDREHG